MRFVQWGTHFLLRMLLFFVALGALALLGFVAVSFVSAQLGDIPEQPRVALITPASEQPLNLSPDALELRLLGFYLRMQDQVVQTPAGADSSLRPFTVEQGEIASTVSVRLQEEGFISDAELFRLYMRYHGIDQRLAAGRFNLSTDMSMPEIAEKLQQPQVEEIVLTVPEGMRAEEVADLLNVRGVMDGEAFLSMVRGGSASARALGDYPFLPDGLTSLEGYLFPDTYRLPAQATPADLIQRMLDNFGQRVSSDILAPAAAAGRGLSQVVTMASIVEREAQLADERPLIASVYWNRVSGACSAETGGAYLQADPTVQYAAGRPGEWWWKPPSVEAYQEIQSPYNTYLRPGLPPGPIASPGLSAIQAAAAPAETNYCFFLAMGDGSHVFATTLAEHQANIARYQQ
jgi:peptidoglycan lytic transglycosylase G